MKKKEQYVQPELLVLELDPESRLMQTLSGTGGGTDMDNPDFGQDPFSVFQDPFSSILSF
ncbi:MAG: hypothetical protein IK074_08855 [Bacteroidales bacterium]|nr:hypothetical protein [Bacteroidales bacterium]